MEESPKEGWGHDLGPKWRNGVGPSKMGATVFLLVSVRTQKFGFLKGLSKSETGSTVFNNCLAA